MKWQNHLVGCGILMLVTAGQAEAAVDIDGSGHATKVTGVAVGSTLYDVTFAVGSFNDAFGSGFPVSPLPTFDGDNAGAGLARDGINVQLNGSGVSLVADMGGGTSDLFIIPTSYDATTVLFSVFGSSNTPLVTPSGPPVWEGTILSTPRTNTTAGFGDTYSYALFEPSSAVIPEPSSLATWLGLAVVGAVASRRCRKRKPASAAS